MADEKIVTSIVANSDFSNLIADVQRVTNSLSKLQQEFAGANRSLASNIDATNAMFSETMRKTGQFSTHFVSLTSDVDKFGRNLDSGRLKLRDYFRVYQENVKTSGGLIRDLAKQQVQLENAVLQPLGRNAQGLMQYNVHIPRGLDVTRNKAAILKQELQIMNKVIQDGGVQLINWGKNTQWAGRQLTVGLTLPLAAFGKAAADAFKVADQELTRLTKVYGDVAGTSAADLAKVREDVAATAKELSSAMGVSFTETIGLAADIAATGKTGNELLASVSETTRLAVLGEVDRQEAMKATLAIQSAFKSNTDELAQSINFLNAVENQTSTTLNDLVEAIPKAGPVIQGLGGNVQDLALYLTAMREGGINASEGANALKSALASLINPTDVAVAKFKGFGIDLLGIVNNNAGDVTKTLFALQASLDKLDPLKKQQAIEQLFGKFQFSRLNALFENLGREGSQTLKVLDLMKASTGDLEAVAARELTAVTESASGRYRRAVETLRAELAGVGDQFLNIGTSIFNVISRIIDFAQKLPEPVKQVLAFGGAFTAIIGPVIMLTGVLANFFGYIIKGLGHFKALFKGAEGFKLLTPEIMAAQAAASQMGDEFYSDAAATDTLRLAIQKLNEDLRMLQKNASMVKSEMSSMGQMISTVGGTPVGAMGGRRVVDPTHPMTGGYSRAAAHLNPRDPNNPSTIFGLTMQPIPLNRKIGKTPQVLMTERLPDVEGLTAVQGMSTGVVAGEHARYSALMATLGIQSKREIEELKKTIAMGGQVSQEFIATFDDILPITQKLSSNAAAQSAAIVAELKAGKINVEQARAAIIAVNADLERSMGVQVGAYAAGRGRTIDLTKAPLIDQPVVDAKGKPNLRGMFRQGIFAKVMQAVGRATGTRTLGAPYSIETTKPQGLNAGGQVYMSGGAMVPGPNVNADVVPAMLTPGEFVVNREATAANLPLLTAINNGYNNGGRVRFQRGHVGAQLPANGLSPSMLAPKSGATSYVAQGIPIWMTANMNQRLRSGDTGLYGAQIYDEFNVALRNGRHPFEPLITAARASGMPGEEARILSVFDDMMNDLRGKDAGKLFQGGTANSFENHFDRKYVSKFGKDFQQLFRSYGTAYGARGSRSMVAQGAVHIDPKTGRMSGISGRGNPLARGIPTGVLGTYSGHGFGGSRARMSQSMSRAALSILSRGRIRMNRGGMVPGYNLGGLIGSTLLGIGGSMAGQKVGEKFGGETGGIAGNILGFMLPSLLMGGRGRGIDNIGRRVGTSADSTFLSKSIVANTKLATSLGNTAVAGNKVTSSFARMALGLTRLNVGLGVATAAVIFGYKKLQEYRENQRLTEVSFGLTEESAKKLGVSFTNYSQRIKDVMASTKALTERNRMLYESIASSGTPLNLTIEQYKKLRKEVKSTMQDQIAFINKTNDKTELSSFAVRLKEQLVAAGVSAEEASKKIYMAFSLSNKSSMAGKVTFGSADFQKIIDAQTAAASSLQTFNDAVDFGNAKSQANALNTALTAIDAGISEIIKKDQERVDKAGKGKVLTQYQAEKKLLDEISSKVGNQKKLSKELLDEMSKHNPELRKFASEQDNVISLWQKMRIAAMGYTGDLSRLTIPQTNALYTMAQKISAAVAETNKTGVLKKQYADLEKLTAQQKKLLAQTKQQTVQEQINSKEAIKAIDKKIAAINKEAEARKKALQEESQDEDIALQIKQKQMEYQQRISAGDLTGAAESQLELQRIVNEQQRVLGERAIEDKRARDVAPLEAQRQKLMDAEEALANKAALAAAELDKVNAKIVKQQGIIDTYNNAMANYKLAVETGVKDLSGFSAALVKAAEAAGISTGKPGYVETVGGPGKAPYRAKTPEELAKDIADKFDTTKLTADKVYINAKEVFGKGQPGSATNPIAPVKGSDAGVDISKWQTPFGSIARKEAKAYAEKEGYKPGTYFTLTSGNKADNTYKEWNLKVDKDGSVILVSTNQPTQKKASGGLLRGPGTGTSDSIIAGFSNGGMVRVSNGEYIINAATVSKLGVPFFDRLNGMKSGGLMLNYDMPKYANGGKLMYNDGGYAQAPTNNNALYNINVTLNGANMSPDDVANAIAAKMQLREAMNGRARTIGG